MPMPSSFLKIVIIYFLSDKTFLTAGSDVLVFDVNAGAV
tara:strand:+ start:312 stop:428 length:117 start_codon:yes stop_codon:yes gene_type:complete